MKNFNPKRIAYTKPSITDQEVAYATDAAANGWGDRCYEYINRFERQFSEFLSIPYAIATSSCTGALHMGLAALSVGPGDEVIVADTNWIATVAPIVYLGATPIFVDIIESTWCIDPVSLENAISLRTKAIIVTHLYGNLCEMDQICEIAARYELPIIEDAAEALGSYWGSGHVGGIGRFGVFSFHGTKTLCTGEGGMLVTNDGALHEKVLTLSNHGRSIKQKKQFYPDYVGFKYKMSNIQAALGCAQLERIDELLSRKREIFEVYSSRLGGMPGITLNPMQAGTVSGRWMTNVVFSADLGITFDGLKQAFDGANIDARVFFHPLSSLPMFKGVPENIVARSIPPRAVNLPSYHDITPDEQARVIDVILMAYESRR